MRVLLLEDNPADTRLIEEAISEAADAGVELVHVTRLASALEQLEAGDVDLVLLDLSVPDSHGFETFTKAQISAGEVPIVVLSGSDDEELAVRAVRAGAQDYLVKGHVDGNLLVRAMRYAIERQRAEVALRHSEQALRELATKQMALAEIGRIVSSSLQLGQVFDSFAEQVGRLMPLGRITIGLSDRARNEYEVAFASGVDVGARERGDVISLRGSIAERVVETKSTVLFQPLSLDDVERGFPAASPIFEAGLRSFLCAPLISNDGVIGLLHIQSTQVEAYSEHDVTTIESIAAQIAGAVSSSQLHAALRNAEEATRQSEARFRDLFDAAPVGYHELNLDGRITRVNRTELAMLGFASDEMMGHEMWDFLAEDEREKARHEDEERLTGCGSPDQHFERQFRHRDGSHIPVLVQSRLLRDGGGNIIGTRATIQDISERKRSEEERERLIVELRGALARIKTLSGLLPICSSCKKIRDDKGYWSQIETYIRDRTDADFSHGLCPVCAYELYPELRPGAMSG